MLTRLKTVIVRHLPWWVVLSLGVGCVVVGGVLTAEPFRSLSVLHWLVAASLVLTGVSELASAGASARRWLSRLVGVGLIVAGVLAASWPGITVHGLAVVVGIALVVGGAGKIVTVSLSFRWRFMPWSPMRLLCRVCCEETIPPSNPARSEALREKREGYA
jgi:uncharacterized membrane protein HdeD (DUF308 family)